MKEKTKYEDGRWYENDNCFIRITSVLDNIEILYSHCINKSSKLLKNCKDITTHNVSDYIFEGELTLVEDLSILNQYLKHKEDQLMLAIIEDFKYNTNDTYIIGDDEYKFIKLEDGGVRMKNLENGYPYSFDKKIFSIKNDIIEKEDTTQKLYRRDLKQIYNIACKTWKAILDKYAIRTPLEDFIYLKNTEVSDMFENATSEQIHVLSKYLKRNKTIKITKDTMNKMIEPRTFGEYTDIAFKLNCNKFDWKLVTDSKGVLCLVPSYKSNQL